MIAVYKIPDGAHPDIAALDLLSEFWRIRLPEGCTKLSSRAKKRHGTMGGVWMLHEPGVMYYGATVRKEGNLDDVKETHCCASCTTSQKNRRPKKKLSGAAIRAQTDRPGVE